ncbi:MAG: hypothetical protein IPO44_16250 [Candidatus Microthrix sp.]|nr:hypothetical protein [Candidatus Microthrix sp.]MBK9561032.1 hypothetical protein [Candidatus Microthrix sp.]
MTPVLRKNRWPCRNWRAIASPLGRLPSASTHMPPRGTHRPASTASEMPSATDGYSSIIHWY